jgi:DNA-binding beta-propeller fold protein YncE
VRVTSQQSETERAHEASHLQRWLAALVCTFALAAVVASTAEAQGGRRHAFAGTFSGEGASALADPTGVAVDEATGEVFVIDRASPHERVERFRATAAGGFEFVSSFDVRSPEDIAVDNSREPSDPSRGDVYVVGASEEGASQEEHDVLYKYSPTEQRMIFKKAIFKGVYEHEHEELELEGIEGVAVDDTGALWVYWGEEGTISGFSDAQVNRWLPGETRETDVEGAFECRARPGFAVAPNAEWFYVGHEQETPEESCPEEADTPTVVAKLSSDGTYAARDLDGENSTGVTVDPLSGEVFLDNVTSVASFAFDGTLYQRFGGEQLTDGAGLTVDGATGEVLAAEPAENQVALFAAQPAGPPIVGGAYAQSLGSGDERLLAQVDPNGAPTTYYFQYGTGSCASEPSSCVEAPLAPGSQLGEGYGYETASVQIGPLEPNTTYHYRVIAQNANGASAGAEQSEQLFTTLPSADATLLDHRSWELVSPVEKHGQTIEAISREGADIQAAVDGDAIAWSASGPVTGDAQGDRSPEPEQVLSTRSPTEGWSSQDVSTPHNAGEGIEPGEATEYRDFDSSLSSALVEPEIQEKTLEDPPLSPEAREKTIYIRDDENETYEPLVTGADDTAATQFGGKLEFSGATPDLAHVVFESSVPLVPGATGEGLYEWEAGKPLRLLSTLPGTSTPASEPSLGDLDRDVRNAISRDGTHVVWTNGSKDEGPLYVTDTQTAQTLQVNAAQGVAEAGEDEVEEGLDEVHFQDASVDGSRIFFTDTWPLTADSTLEPHESEEVIQEPPEGGRNVGRPADLYELDVETDALTDLTPDDRAGESADVLGTIPGASEDGSDVYFVANGALAPGAEPGDCPRTKPKVAHPDAACNLYLSEPAVGGGGRETRLVARLSDEDAADWEEGDTPPGSLGGLTAQVSPNGRFIAFMSQQPLTGYDNVDADPEAHGARDQEVYLYDATLGRLVCASCDPSGAPPLGVYDRQSAGEGLGLVVDRPETWKGHWLAGSIPGWTLYELTNPETSHQSRYLSDSGRLFFDGAGAVLPAVTAPTRAEEVNGKQLEVGVENVYEYEPDGIGTCEGASGCLGLVSSGTSDRESAFLDASESGNDVFFMTAAQLVAQDDDNSLDVYDARVCGTAQSEPCLPPIAPPPLKCNGEECHGAPPAPISSAQETVSEGYSGPGNGASSQVLGEKHSSPAPKRLTRKQLLANALKACRKLKRHRRRAQCESSARRRYAPAAKRSRAKSTTPGKGHKR